MALTLPGMDRFQMSSELERCQVLLSSVDIFELVWPQVKLSVAHVSLCSRLCDGLCVPVRVSVCCAFCGTLGSSVFDFIELRGERVPARWKACPPACVCVRVCTSRAGL